MTSPLTSRARSDDMVGAAAVNRASTAEVGEDRACAVQPAVISGAISAVWRQANVRLLLSPSSSCNCGNCVVMTISKNHPQHYSCYLSMRYSISVSFDRDSIHEIGRYICYTFIPRPCDYCDTGNTEIATFSSNVVCFFAKEHVKHIEVRVHIWVILL